MKGAILATLLLLVFSSPSVASQPPWQAVGSGDMRWTFFKLYRVTLLTDDGAYVAEDYPQALEILYYRNIDNDDLVKATADQWQKLGIPDEQSRAWLSSLQSLWPDIRQNDILRIEVDAAGNNRFLHNGQPIGSIDDPEFSTSFLSIWLSPDTTRPDIRKKLVGGQTGDV